MARRLVELRADLEDKRAEAQRILDAAEKENRPLESEESKKLEALSAEMKALENIGGLDAEQKALSDVLYRTFKDVIDQACTERERLERLQKETP